MPRRNKVPRHLTHARAQHFSLKQMVQEIDISYTLGTTTVLDNEYIQWPGPCNIDDDAIVTIGDGATAEVQDKMINVASSG